MDALEVTHLRWREERTLCASEDSNYADYYAFPALLRLREDTVLVAYKKGEGHMGDKWAPALEQTRLDVKTQRTCVSTLYQREGEIPQMGEYALMPNGDVCVYIDMQELKLPSRRTGIVELRSSDGGKTYPQHRALGMVDGVEYGYTMECMQWKGAVYMLAMTFEYLRGSRAREVHLLRSEDSGLTWSRAMNLTQTCGQLFNECSFVPYEDGFCLFTRGESDRTLENGGNDAVAPQSLFVFDGALRLVRWRDYRNTTSFFTLTGRPRLLWLDERLYLVTRQTRCDSVHGGKMTLDLYRIDPQTMAITAQIRLDEQRFGAKDGHYAMAYLDETRERLLRVITYAGSPFPANATIRPRCDIVQLSFLAEEIGNA